jgi:putative effector of murein hydrolase LrgA (UPF0299 family)
VIAGIATLLFCQLLGEVAVRGLGLPIPGPVVGLVLLVALLWAANRRFGDDRLTAATAPLGRVADGLLASLALLFVPAGVGVVQYLGLISAEATAIGAALVLSTLATLVATVATFVALRRLVGGDDGEGEP